MAVIFAGMKGSRRMKECSLFLRKKEAEDEEMCVIFAGNHDFKYPTSICRKVIEEMFAILAGNHDFDYSTPIEARRKAKENVDFWRNLKDIR